MKAIVRKTGDVAFLEMKLNGEEVKLLVNEMKRNLVHTKDNREEYAAGTYTLPLQMLMGQEDF